MLPIPAKLSGLLVVIVAAIVAIGCGSPSHPSVAGTVTMDSAPLPDALISFIPEEGTGSPAIATTDEEGKYTLEDGVAAGTYTVRITTYQPAIAEIDPPTAGVEEQVPTKYNIDTTLSAEVSSGENTCNFPLDSKGKIIQPRESL